MANIHSQKKRILRSERERLENRHYTSAVRTYFRRLETAVAAGDDAVADTEHKELVSLIDKSVKRGAMHKNTGARKKSRASRVRRGPRRVAPPSSAQRQRRSPGASASRCARCTASTTSAGLDTPPNSKS